MHERENIHEIEGTRICVLSNVHILKCMLNVRGGNKDGHSHGFCSYRFPSRESF
jgi:hypothetical protein